MGCGATTEKKQNAIALTRTNSVPENSFNMNLKLLFEPIVKSNRPYVSEPILNTTYEKPLYSSCKTLEITDIEAEKLLNDMINSPTDPIPMSTSLLEMWLKREKQLQIYQLTRRDKSYD